MNAIRKAVVFKNTFHTISFSQGCLTFYIGDERCLLNV